jgi:hypothetical protein
MKKIGILSLIFLGVGLFCLSGCFRSGAATYSAGTPRFTPEQHMVGDLEGTGAFFDRFANLKRAFTIKAKGEFKDGIVTLTEDLTFLDNGEKNLRVYKVSKVDDNHYKVDCDDLTRTGSIESFGNVMRWDYTLKTKIGDGIWSLTFDDWMFLQSNGVVLNRAKAYKWGIEVGEIFMSFRQVEPK